MHLHLDQAKAILWILEIGWNSVLPRKRPLCAWGLRRRIFAVQLEFTGVWKTEKKADALFDDRMVLGRSLNRDMLLQFSQREMYVSGHTSKSVWYLWREKKEPFSIMDEAVTREVYEHPINKFSIRAKEKLIPTPAFPWNL